MFRRDGTLVWSSSTPAATYTVQTVSSLPGRSNWVDYNQIYPTNSVNTNQINAFNLPAGMALIPAGSFTMGNSTGDSDITGRNPINVTVLTFYMDVNLVTVSLWTNVCQWATNHGYNFLEAGGGATNQPVYGVAWYSAVKWCNARSQQAGFTPVYYTDAGLTQVYTNGGDLGTFVYPNWSANGYRLPTDAEWEKAARGGLSGKRFPWGDTISESQANYWSIPFIYSYDLGPGGANTNFDTGGMPYTSPVGYFAPNGYGLYDMAGNLNQWCWDWADSTNWGVITVNPTGSTTVGYTGRSRVIRGGDWDDFANRCRCAYSLSNYPYLGEPIIGFRCVRGL